MEDNGRPQNTNWPKYVLIALAAVVLIFAWGAFTVVQSVRQTTGQLLSPVNAFSTQAAEVLHPTPTIIADPTTIVHEIQALARLETVHYTMEKVIRADSGTPSSLDFLFGDQLLLIAYGEVIAGVDMAEIEAEDLRLRNGVLYVTLPPAEVFVATLNNDKSYVYDRDTGLLSRGDIDLETLARQVAEDEILQAALEDGILDQAEINAEHFLVRFFRALGYQDTVLEFGED